MTLLIFDLQGTLLENGVFPSPVKQIKFTLGIRQDFHEYVPMLESVFMTKKFDSLSQAFQAVSEHFGAGANDFAIEKLVGVWNKNKILSKPFPETIQVLEELKGDYKMVLVANIDCFTKDVIERFKLGEYFDKVFLSCDTGLLKGEILFKEILKSLDTDAADAIVIGDSLESDIKGAEAAGIKAILVDRNHRMLYDNKISTLRELKNMVG